VDEDDDDDEEDGDFGVIKHEEKQEEFETRKESDD